MKRKIALIKKHWSILLMMPTILGAVWQLNELVSIDVSLIKFFSSSQLVIDGFFYLLILLFIFSLLEGLNKIIKDTIFSFIKKEIFDVFDKGNNVSVKILIILKRIGVNGFWCIIFHIFTLFLMRHLDEVNNKTPLTILPWLIYASCYIGRVIVIFTFLLKCLVAIYLIYYILLYKNHNIVYFSFVRKIVSFRKNLIEKIKQGGKGKKEIIYLYKRFPFFGFISTGLFIHALIWNVVYYPYLTIYSKLEEKLLNIQYIENKLQAKYNLPSKPALAYINNEYMFFVNKDFKLIGGKLIDINTPFDNMEYNKNIKVIIVKTSQALEEKFE